MRRTPATAVCLAPLIAILLSGCLTLERPNIKPVSIGMPMEQVKENLGPPAEVTASRDGQEWEYHFGYGENRETALLQFDEYDQLEQINNLPGAYLAP